MTSTLVDTNVLIDVLGADLPGRAWSLDALQLAVSEGVLVLSAIVWAEMAHEAIEEGVLERALSRLRAKREDFPFAAAYAAGVAHRRYRGSGGRRERTLPDFLIGAHALVGGHRLLTRDARRYRSYFPDLEIIAPDTHA